MHPEQPSPDPIVARAKDLRRAVFNATAAANNPDLVYPDWPEDKPLPDLSHWQTDAETTYYQYASDHRDQLSELEEFRGDYEFLDMLAAEQADLRDYQTWTHDPEEPLRRADRRRSR